MKFLQTTFAILLCSVTMTVFSQSVKDKAAKFDEYVYPNMPIAGIEKVKITVYAEAGLDISQGDLYERKGLGKKLQAKQDQINNFGPIWVTFQNYSLVGSSEDANIELAFGGFEQTGKKLRDHEIVCVRDDGKLDKEDIKKCPAYYYEVNYTLPVVVKITDNSGKILNIAHIDAPGTATYGYDASGLSGYMRTNELDEAFAKPTALQSIKKDAIQDRLEEAGAFLQENFYFQEEKVKIDIASGGGKLDYTDLDEAQTLAIEALENLQNPGSDENIQKAIGIWNKALEEVDMNDKKARINRRLAGFLALNKAKTYYYVQDYDKALESTDEAGKYLKFSANTAHMESVNSWEHTINNAKGNASSIEKNKSLVVGAPAKASALIELIKVKEKDAPYEIIQLGQKYDDFKADYVAYSGANDQQNVAEQSQPDSISDMASMLMGGGMTESGDVDWESRMQKVSNMGYYITIAYTNNETIPTGICDLEPLNTLLANNAKISSVPKEIGQLKNLETLNLAANSLNSLPEEIGELESLKKLNLSKNSLSSLPTSLSNCQNLKTLILKGNSIPQSEIDQLQSALPNCKIKL